MSERPSRKELSEIRLGLKADGKNICYGELCDGKVKDLGEFVKNRNDCLECNRYSSKMSQKKNMRANKRLKFKLKLDKQCEVCGCSDIDMLEFDHIDPDDKSFTISGKNSTQQILEEVHKTRLLCIWCHRLHSEKQVEENVKKSKEDYEYSEKENNETINLKHSKVCKGMFCKGRRRNSKYFYVCKNKLSRKCKKCNGYESMLKRRKNKEYIDNIKLKIGGCQKCDRMVTLETTCCFDFDHIVRDKKALNISALARYSYDAKGIIDNEIKKCQLLCCYCHRKKTFSECNYKTIDLDKIDQLDDMRKTGDNTFNKCPKCNNDKHYTAKLCNKCDGISRRTVKRPPYDQLLTEIKELGYVKVGRKYSVSDNAIRKWVKNYKQKNMN